MCDWQSTKCFRKLSPCLNWLRQQHYMTKHCVIIYLAYSSLILQCYILELCKKNVVRYERVKRNSVINATRISHKFSSMNPMIHPVYNNQCCHVQLNMFYPHTQYRHILNNQPLGLCNEFQERKGLPNYSFTYGFLIIERKNIYIQ